MSEIDILVLAKIDDLQFKYINSLDTRDMHSWLKTFSEISDTSYICKTAEGVSADLPIALMLDDCHNRIEDRVTFVTKIWAGTYQEYQTRHIVQRIECNKASSSDCYDVKSNFIISYTPSDTGKSEILTTGIYLDQVIIDKGKAQFRAKQVITDTPILPRYIVFPL